MITLYIGIGTVLILGSSFFMFRLRHKRMVKSPSLYMDALNHMLEDKYEEALERLKQTVKSDTENIMAYIYLGDMFRKLKFPVRASKVHQNLLVRNNLPQDLLIIILHRLILDYREAKMLDKAAEVAERLIQINKHDVQAKEMLLSLYEKRSDWDKAFFHRQNLNRWMKKKDQDILALYKVQSGLDQVSNGKEREGRIRFREAIKLDKKCVSAYLYWSDSYRREGRKDDALRVLKDFIQQNPEWAHLGFDRLKMLLYDLGRFGDIEQHYNTVIRKKPQKPDVYLALIDLYIREGRYDEAEDLAHKTIDMYPDHGPCHLALIKVYERQERNEDALKLSMQLLNKEFRMNDILSCQYCGYETSDPLWLCPQCHQWKSFLS